MHDDGGKRRTIQDVADANRIDLVPKECIWNFLVVGAPELNGEIFQHGKGTVSQLEELVKVGFYPFKGDLAHAIRVMMKCSTQAP